MMFFHINSIREFITLVQSWAFVTLAIIVIAIRGERINKGENQWLIIDGKEEFDKEVLPWATILENNMNNFLKYKMEVNQGCDGNL